MHLQASSLGYLLWFALAGAIGVWISVSGQETTPAIESRARTLNVLERALVAVRQAAQQPKLDSPTVRAALLTHGIMAIDEPVRSPEEKLRLRLRVSPHEDGEMRVIVGPDGHLVVRVRSGHATEGLELGALVRPPGDL